jgi:hypothetical protein
MAKKYRKVVRVVVFDSEDAYGHVSTFIENLRYAGLVKVHSTHDGEPLRTVFDILPPHGVEDVAWAQMNADRMTSFGYNAVSAPEMG